MRWVSVKSGIIYFATSKDIRVTVVKIESWSGTLTFSSFVQFFTFVQESSFYYDSSVTMNTSIPIFVLLLKKKTVTAMLGQQMVCT